MVPVGWCLFVGSDVGVCVLGSVRVLVVWREMLFVYDEFRGALGSVGG